MCWLAFGFFLFVCFLHSFELDVLKTSLGYRFLPLLSGSGGALANPVDENSFCISKKHADINISYVHSFKWN